MISLTQLIKECKYSVVSITRVHNHNRNPQIRTCLILLVVTVCRIFLDIKMENVLSACKDRHLTGSVAKEC